MMGCWLLFFPTVFLSQLNKEDRAATDSIRFFRSILSSLYIFTGFNITNTAKWWCFTIIDESHIPSQICLFVAFCVVPVHCPWDLPFLLLDSILDIIFFFCCTYKDQNRSQKPCITPSLCSHLQPVSCSALVVVSLVSTIGRASSVVFHLHQVHTLTWEELVVFSQKLTL